MAVSGPRFPQEATLSNITGGKAWQQYARIKADDNQCAYVRFTGEEDSNHLVAHKFEFENDVALFNAAQIDGIKVEFELFATLADHIKTIDLILTGDAGISMLGANKYTNDYWPTSLTVWTAGGAADKWGYNWVPSLVCQQGFGVMLKCEQWEENDTLNALVDYIKVTVYYS